VNERRVLACVAVLAAAVVSTAVPAAERDGRAIVNEQCVLCHGSGRDGAPKIGDNKAWAARAERGLSSLTDSALTGVRKMPPQGGKLSLTDIELKHAIVYMVNQSGGHWNDPIDKEHLPGRRSGEAIVKAQCVKCHGEGLHGAPRLGDRKAWIQRAKSGVEALQASATRGHGGMPARGGMADLTDAELRSAVSYMIRESLKSGSR